VFAQPESEVREPAHISEDQVSGSDTVLGTHRVQTCRRELLDRTLTWNQRHLLHALCEFEQFYNAHRPHQGIANARPLRALPSPVPRAPDIIDR
jgi:hypothetical protein